jgi:hypothetical protein
MRGTVPIAKAVDPPGGALPDDEAALVERAKLDLGAFAPLYARYADPVYCYCFRPLARAEEAEHDGKRPAPGVSTRVMAMVEAIGGAGWRSSTAVTRRSPAGGSNTRTATCRLSIEVVAVCGSYRWPKRRQRDR